MDGDDITQFDRALERNIVDRCGHTEASAATVGAYRGGDVHPIQQIPSHQIAQRIRVVGHDDAGA